MNEELKPCPFCGGEAHIGAGYGSAFDGTVYFAECMMAKCPAQPELDCFDTVEKAAEVWNTRPVEDALRARIADLEEALKIVRALYQAECNRP